MKRAILLLALVSMTASAAHAGGPGTTNANFLKAGQGVRPIALGESYTALGDGLDTLYWNPAGLVQIDAPTASLAHSFWIQDVNLEYVAYGMSLGPLGAVGGGITVLHTSLEQTLEDEFGNYAGTGGSVSAVDFAFIGTYAQKLSRLIPSSSPLVQNMLIGASLRVVSEGLPDAEGILGGAVDIGAIWRETEEIKPAHVASATGQVVFSNDHPLVRDRGWRVGVVARNLGMTTDQMMPIDVRAGVGYVAQELFSPYGQGTITVDALVPVDNDIKFSLGAEYAHISPHTKFAARVGYKIGNEIKDLDALAGLTAGIGAAIQAGALTYQIDYAFVPYGELGTTHRAALTLAFLSGPNAVAAPVAPLAGLVSAGGAQPVAPDLVKKAESAPTEANKADTNKTESKKEEPQKDEPKREEAKPAEVAPAEAAEPATEPTPSIDLEKAKLEQLQKMLDRISDRVERGRLPAIEFKSGTNAIAGETKKTLDEYGKLLERYPDGNILVTGHAANDKALAESRGRAAIQYLALRFGINRDRFTVQAGSGTQPANAAVTFAVAGAATNN